MAEKIKVAVRIPLMGRLVGVVLLAGGLFLILTTYLVACVQLKKRNKGQQMEINLGERKIEGKARKEVSPLLHKAVKTKIVPTKNEQTC